MLRLVTLTSTTHFFNIHHWTILLSVTISCVLFTQWNYFFSARCCTLNSSCWEHLIDWIIQSETQTTETDHASTNINHCMRAFIPQSSHQLKRRGSDLTGGTIRCVDDCPQVWNLLPGPVPSSPLINSWHLKWNPVPSTAEARLYGRELEMCWSKYEEGGGLARLWKTHRCIYQQLSPGAC